MFCLRVIFGPSFGLGFVVFLRFRATLFLTNMMWSELCLQIKPICVFWFVWSWTAISSMHPFGQKDTTKIGISGSFDA